MAKEEKKQRKAKMKTKHCQDDASTSAIPQAPTIVTLDPKAAETLAVTLKTNEGAQPMDVEEEREHRECKAPMKEERKEKEQKPEPKAHHSPNPDPDDGDGGDDDDDNDNQEGSDKERE